MSRRVRWERRFEGLVLALVVSVVTVALTHWSTSRLQQEGHRDDLLLLAKESRSDAASDVWQAIAAYKAARYSLSRQVEESALFGSGIAEFPSVVEAPDASEIAAVAVLREKAFKALLANSHDLGEETFNDFALYLALFDSHAQRGDEIAVDPEGASEFQRTMHEDGVALLAAVEQKIQRSSGLPMPRFEKSVGM